jgi:hypothetical protein
MDFSLPVALTNLTREGIAEGSVRRKEVEEA